MKTVFTVGAVLAMAGAASAVEIEKLLIVDISVENQVTFTTAGGASAATVSGSDGIGVLLAGFFNDTTPGFGFTGTGDLTSFLNTSDGTPGLFRFSGSEGLNFWSFTNDTDTLFEAGVQAFSGSATWDVSPEVYAGFLAGNTSGDIYAFADDDSDIPNATVIGTWNVIPTPGAAGLLGLAGLAAVRRRR